MYKRILTIQDISCVGQCSLTVALPIISACGHETAILPSAVLSTHTAGFTGYTFRDLTDDIPAIKDHWVKENLKFDAIYTGYLGSTEQIDMIKDIFEAFKGAKRVVDPAMADNGKLYPAFDDNYVKAMAVLCKEADILLPNITEACLLTGYEYKEKYDEKYIDGLLQALKDAGMKDIVLTGVSYNDDHTGVVVYEGGYKEYYSHKKISKGCHGTGDVYASAFVGKLMNGVRLIDAAKSAADFVVDCIEYTQANVPDHTYGVAFEPVLKTL